MNTKNIRRDTFESFMSNIHVANPNDLPPDTKIGRVVEYFDELRKNFKNCCIWEKEFDVDECMVEYFGRYGTFLKQSIRMKPIRFGYKVWCANLASGYLFDFDVYEGSTGRKTQNVAKYGLGAGVVLDLIDRMPKTEDGDHMPSLLAVDNFFNSYRLVQECSSRNVPILGTLRQDRIQNAPLLGKKEMLKKCRGYYENAHSRDDIAVVTWRDMSTMGSLSWLQTHKGLSLSNRRSVGIGWRRSRCQSTCHMSSRCTTKRWAELIDRIRILTSIVLTFGQKSGGGHCFHGALMSRSKMLGSCFG